MGSMRPSPPPARASVKPLADFLHKSPRRVKQGLAGGGTAKSAAAASPRHLATRVKGHPPLSASTSLIGNPASLAFVCRRCSRAISWGNPADGISKRHTMPPLPRRSCHEAPGVWLHCARKGHAETSQTGPGPARESCPPGNSCRVAGAPCWSKESPFGGHSFFPFGLCPHAAREGRPANQRGRPLGVASSGGGGTGNLVVPPPGNACGVPRAGSRPVAASDVQVSAVGRCGGTPRSSGWRVAWCGLGPRRAPAQPSAGAIAGTPGHAARGSPLRW